MKYAITGSAGHISKPLAEKLLQNGHEVTVIGRDAAHLKPLTDKGAKAATGSIEEAGFLTQAFAGADAVYTMVPPQYGGDINVYETLGKKYAQAIKANNIKYVVNLSSVGAHLPKGGGPVSGLHKLEEVFNQLEGVNVLHLRPGFFYVNFYANMDMIRHMNLLGGNYGDASARMILSHPADIAEVAAEELLKLKFTGHSVRYIASDERSTGEVARVLGSAIGKPELPWVEFTDEQVFGALQQAGLPEGLARNYAEMGAAMRTGTMWEDYLKHRPAQLGKTRLEDFARDFSAAYH